MTHKWRFFGHLWSFFENYIEIFHNNEDQTVILRYLVCLTLLRQCLDLGNFDIYSNLFFFLDTICPFCGHDFNRTVRQVAEFSIGLFFACLFTFQLIPILVTIGPALVRASVLILIHPGNNFRGFCLIFVLSQSIFNFEPNSCYVYDI